MAENEYLLRSAASVPGVWRDMEASHATLDDVLAAQLGSAGSHGALRNSPQRMSFVQAIIPPIRRTWPSQGRRRCLMMAIELCEPLTCRVVELGEGGGMRIVHHVPLLHNRTSGVDPDLCKVVIVPTRTESPEIGRKLSKSLVDFVVQTNRRLDDNFKQWGVDENSWWFVCFDWYYDSFLQADGHDEVSAGLSEAIARVWKCISEWATGKTSAYCSSRSSTCLVLVSAHNRERLETTRHC